MTTRIHDLKENLTYLALWLLLFLTPFVSMAIRASANADFTFEWVHVFRVWRTWGIYLIIFLIHNFVLAPLLIYKHKKVMYFVTAFALLTIFVIYQCTQKPHRHMRHEPRNESSMVQERHHPDDAFSPIFPPDGEPMPHEEMLPPSKPSDDINGKRMMPRHKGKRPKKFDDTPPFSMGPADIIHTIMVVLLLGMNLGIKLYFKSDRDAMEMQLLEKKNLEQQLEYLKYQINPHFFMNTLNNIHALVDIDAEKAKTTILELSKLMRYVLYEGAKSSVLLRHEVNFLNNYITLMKLRFTDKVKIEVNFPSTIPEKSIPPMLFITFVENAFKHGISYKEESYIKMDMHLKDNRIFFTCINSKHNESMTERGGVGLQNVKKRLELIYGEQYELDITDGVQEYMVKLNIPTEVPVSQTQSITEKT